MTSNDTTDIEYRDKEGENSGSKSDASYRKRLHFQSLVAASLSSNSTLADGGDNAGSKLLSARARLLQGAGDSVAAPDQASAIMLDIQQAPERLRPLLLIRFAPHLRLLGWPSHRSQGRNYFGASLTLSNFGRTA
jgi:hypothetical protein